MLVVVVASFALGSVVVLAPLFLAGHVTIEVGDSEQSENEEEGKKSPGQQSESGAQGGHFCSHLIYL